MIPFKYPSNDEVEPEPGRVEEIAWVTPYPTAGATETTVFEPKSKVPVTLDDCSDDDEMVINPVPIAVTVVPEETTPLTSETTT